MDRIEPFVYIAGKYMDITDIKIQFNIGDAELLARKCANHHIKHFCPHLHSANMHRYAPDTPREWWLELDFEIIKKVCNCMLMVDNWEDSEGARLERRLARELHYPIFYNFENLLKHTKGVPLSTA